MLKFTVHIIFFFLAFGVQSQSAFDSWKSLVQQQLNEPKELVQVLTRGKEFILKSESKRRTYFFAIDDSLAAREMHFERRIFFDSLIAQFERSNLKSEVRAKYMLRLANACYDTDQGERAAIILTELFEPKYKLSNVDRLQCRMRLGNLELSFQLPELAVKSYQGALREMTPVVEKKFPMMRSSVFNNMGLAFSLLGEVDSTIYYHRKALHLREEAESTYLMGQSYNNIGSMYYRIKEYDSALVYYERGLHYRSISPELIESSIAESWTNLGKTWFQLGNLNKAKELLEKSLVYCERVNNLEIKKRNYEILHELYSSEGNDAAAYEALGNYYLYRDSLYGLAETKEVLHNSYKQELREQALSDSLNQVANQKVYEEKSRREEVIKYGLGVALIALISILGLLVINYRNKVKSNRQISSQKNSLKEKNEEIIGSITYAKRLQDAILPLEQNLQKYLSEHFVYYRPKDIVAGDFYWMKSDEDATFFAVADCTGHGVPGAMVSIICSNALNRSTNEFGLKDTGAILDKTTDLVLESFSESEENVSDGMDVGLIRLGKKKDEMQEVQFSGAYNGLWIVTDNKEAMLEQLKEEDCRVIETVSKCLVEVKATRQPVGFYDTRIPFKATSIILQEGDTLYMHTDGFSDQFGGKEFKKYKTSKLKRFILEISSQPISEQKSLIEKEFDHWRGDNEQIDDVCIAGIYIN